jgi:metal-responsive CopG/Arc/MetJ family transcriptional regulator
MMARINITIKAETLKAIDAYCKEHGLTRSGFFRMAAMKWMRERNETQSPSSTPSAR